MALRSPKVSDSDQEDIIKSDPPHAYPPHEPWEELLVENSGSSDGPHVFWLNKFLCAAAGQSRLISVTIHA